MGMRQLELSRYERREHMQHFLTMEAPFITLTVQKDITQLYHAVHRNRKPMFLSLQYAIVGAANTVPELRRRLRDGGIVEYDVCGASYTVAIDDGTYRYCAVRTEQPYEQYLCEAHAKQMAAMKSEHLVEDEDPESCFFISYVPGCIYTALDLPKPNRYFSVPTISWGSYYKRAEAVDRSGHLELEEHVLLPITIMVNHALVDGVHIATFLKETDIRMERLARMLEAGGKNYGI